LANIRKCPLCGGDVLGKTCFSCGYEFPDEKTMRETHDFEPDEPALMPEPEDILPPPRFYDKDYEAPRVKVAENRQNGYVPPPYSGDQKSAYSGKNATFDDFCRNFSEMTFGQKLKKYWWAVLLSLMITGVIPIVAAVGIKIFSKSKYSNDLVTSLLLLGVISFFVFG
jgi:hypothetical protein